MGRPTAEQIFRGMFRSAPSIDARSRASQYAGRTTLNSGSATVTVSTTIVDSDSIILTGFASGDAADVGSGLAKGIEVKSLNPGNAMVLGTVDGITMARDTTIMWVVFRTQ